MCLGGSRAAFEVVVAELSGASHRLIDLHPSDTVGELYAALEGAAELNPRGCALVVGEDILYEKEFGMQLQDVGIKSGMTLTLVQINAVEVFEFAGMVGDEDYVRGSTCNTVVRVAFTRGNTCVLVRQTYTRWQTGSYTWDICSGTFATKENNALECTWRQCYRRRRAGVARGNFTGMDDSGWNRLKKIPQVYREVNPASQEWSTRMTPFQERDEILGIRLAGFGSCAEAITLMGLAHNF